MLPHRHLENYPLGGSSAIMLFDVQSFFIPCLKLESEMVTFTSLSMLATSSAKFPLGQDGSSHAYSLDLCQSSMLGASSRQDAAAAHSQSHQ